ncbi:hypothetical protein TrVGV298_011270 [Trichoderma virens]|nr:hypothetical protein TrVGV298_011270 [Trichoderma virens]
MPFGLPSKKSSALATKPEAMASEVTLVGQSNTMSEKQASAGPSKKETKMTWKEAQEACRKEHSWEILANTSNPQLASPLNHFIQQHSTITLSSNAHIQHDPPNLDHVVPGLCCMYVSVNPFILHYGEENPVWFFDILKLGLIKSEIFF